MKAKINNDNKAKFFALYYDQPVMFETGFVLSFHLRFIRENREIEKFGKSAFLSLKHLSQISDEDAIQVAEIIARIEHLKLDRESRINYVKNNIQILVLRNSEVSYYLRSRGYALPWMGISVEEQIEAGWVKLMEG